MDKFISPVEKGDDLSADNDKQIENELPDNTELPEENSEAAQFERDFIAGKRIITAIVIYGWAQLVLSQILPILFHSYGITDGIRLILWSVAFIELYRGARWARNLFLVGCALSIVSIVMKLQAVSTIGLHGIQPVFWFDVVNIIILGSCCGLLMFSEKVNAYFEPPRRNF